MTDLTGRIRRCTGKQPTSFERVLRGYTPARRWIVRFEDGTSAFVKEAADADTARWLREEVRIYRQLQGDFLPSFLGWDDSEDAPILVLEDLSQASWPPPWNPARVQGVRQALEELWAVAAPLGQKRLSEYRDELQGWTKVAADPAPFLSLGFCSSSWLDACLPSLLKAEASAPLDGHSLLHLDVRSDNLCFAGDRAVLVDWNWAAVGNPDFDLGFWLPSLEAEGGPPPDAILPNAGPIAGIVSGFFASQAGLPPIPSAPRVREVQRLQLATALPWAARALGLPCGEPHLILRVAEARGTRAEQPPETDVSKP